MSSSLSNYSIQVEKEIYFPGETVRGSVFLSVSQPITNRGVRVELQSLGHCKFKVNDDTMRRTEYYARDRITVWGNVFKTPTIDGGGTDVTFNPPWSPNEGRLLIPIPQDGTVRQLLVQVRDEDWGKRDDLIGEFVLDINSAVASSQQGVVSTGLFRNGSTEKGTVTFMAYWAPNYRTMVSSTETTNTLCIHFQSARELRNPNWVGKSDVYVQAYFPPDQSKTYDCSSEALPNPSKTYTLEPGSYTFPFEFHLPSDLPSSIELSASINARGHVRHSIYSSLDIKWMVNPSTRKPFTLIQPIPASMPSLFNRGMKYDKEKKLGIPMCIPPFCCCFFDLPGVSFGQLGLSLEIPRSGFAPGECLPIDATVTNRTSRQCKLVVTIVLHGNLRANSRHRRVLRHFAIGSVPVEPQFTGKLDTLMPIVPPLAPTFAGSGKDRDEWMKANRNSTFLPRFYDPVVWKYVLEVRLVVPMGIGLCSRHPIVITAFPPTVALQQGVQVPQMVQQHVPTSWDTGNDNNEDDIPVANVSNWQDQVDVPFVAQQAYHTKANTNEAFRIGGNGLDDTDDRNTFNRNELSSFSPTYLNFEIAETQQQQQQPGTAPSQQEEQDIPVATIIQT